MTDSSKRFRVYNIHAVFPGLITVCTLVLLIYVGALFMKPDAQSVIRGCIVLAFIAMTLAYFFLRCRAVVDYDGKVIRVRALLRKYEIDLEKVSRIEYSLHSGFQRYSNYCIKMEFFYSDDQSDSDVIYDTTGRIDLNKLIQGDHTDLPIMQMYDDIISRYPEMNAKKSDDSE